MDEKLNRIQNLFDGADRLYTKAMNELNKNDLKNACGRGWGAVLLANSALILAKTGEEPREMSTTSQKLSELGRSDIHIGKTMLEPYAKIEAFYQQCFNQEICGSQKDVERNIGEIKNYIEDAKRLSGYTRCH